MTRWPLLPWLLLALWAAWLLTLQALLARPLGAWTPDLWLVLLLALAARLSHEQLPALALVLGVARCALSIDPPAVILAAVLGLCAFARIVRGVVELESAPARALLASLCALLLCAWLEHGQRVRLPEAAPAFEALSPFAHWRVALATGCAALVLAPLFVRLPGLTPLRRRRGWPSAVSARWS